MLIREGGWKTQLWFLLMAASLQNCMFIFTAWQSFIPKQDYHINHLKIRSWLNLLDVVIKYIFLKWVSRINAFRYITTLCIFNTLSEVFFFWFFFCNWLINWDMAFATGSVYRCCSQLRICDPTLECFFPTHRLFADTLERTGIIVASAAFRLLCAQGLLSHSRHTF